MAARVSRAIAAIEANAGQAVEAAAEEVIDSNSLISFLSKASHFLDAPGSDLARSPR